MGERRATIRVDTEGHDKAAADERKVADAQRDVASAAREKSEALKGSGAGSFLGLYGLKREETEATKELDDAQQGLTASTSDYAQAVGMAAPALGMLISAGRAAMKVTGDLGSVNLLAAGNIGKVTGAVKANASSLATLAAGGLAYGAISMAVGAWKDLQEAIEATNQAMLENERIQNRRKGEQMDVRAELAKELAGRDKLDANVDEIMADVGYMTGKGADKQLAVQMAAAGAGEGLSREQMLAGVGAAMVGRVDPTNKFAAQRVAALSDEDAERARKRATFAEQDRRQHQVEEAKRAFAEGHVEEGWLGGRTTSFGAGTEPIERLLMERLGLSREKARAVAEEAYERGVAEAAVRAGGEAPLDTVKVKIPWLGEVEAGSSTATLLRKWLGERSPDEALADSVLGLLGTESFKEGRVGPRAGQQPNVTVNVNPRFYRGAANLRNGRNHQNARDRSGRD